MYDFRLIATPAPGATVEDVRGRAAELADMFVFRRHVVAEVTMPDGREAVELVAVEETDDGPHPTVAAATAAYEDWCAEAGYTVRSLADC